MGVAAQSRWRLWAVEDADRPSGGPRAGAGRGPEARKAFLLACRAPERWDDGTCRAWEGVILGPRRSAFPGHGQQMALRGCSRPWGSGSARWGGPRAEVRTRAPRGAQTTAQARRSTLQGRLPSPHRAGVCPPGPTARAGGAGPGALALWRRAGAHRSRPGARRGGSLRAAAGASRRKGAALGLRRRRGRGLPGANSPRAARRTHRAQPPGSRSRRPGGGGFPGAGSAGPELFPEDPLQARRCGRSTPGDLTAHAEHPPPNLTAPTPPARAAASSHRRGEVTPERPSSTRPTAPNPAPPAVSRWGHSGGRAIPGFFIFPEDCRPRSRGCHRRKWGAERGGAQVGEPPRG